MKKENNLLKVYFTDCWTIPNLLSVIRIIIVPIFGYLFLHDQKIPALILLVISGLTDTLDGKIARRFNQVSELGKMLDPVADKITMITIAIMMLILFRRAESPVMRAAGWVFLVFLIKEFIFVVGGAAMIAFGIKPGAAEIYGKVATCVFYFVMIALIMFGPEVGVFSEMLFTIPDVVAMVMVCISALCTVIAFVGYMPSTAKQVKERFSKN